jgi:hypothetical protein
MRQIFTLPKWSAHDVSNWDELIIKYANGSTKLNDATQCLINFMPLIGITHLSNNNVFDAWIRIALIQATYGPLIVDRDENPVFLTPLDIQRHIGLETEGSSLSLDEFCKTQLPNTSRCRQEKLSSFIANGNKSLLELAMKNTLYME